jgi:hypothetical protein
MDPNLISSGMTSSSQYSNQNGVKFVALDVVVLWDQMTLGNSSAHFPLPFPSSSF